MTGTIRNKVAARGFGFIKTAESKTEYFFHADDCDGSFDSLNIGDPVEFEIVESRKGPRAAKVRMV